MAHEGKDRQVIAYRLMNIQASNGHVNSSLLKLLTLSQRGL